MNENAQSNRKHNYSVILTPRTQQSNHNIMIFNNVKVQNTGFKNLIQMSIFHSNGDS